VYKPQGMIHKEAQPQIIPTYSNLARGGAGAEFRVRLMLACGLVLSQEPSISQAL